LFVDGFYLYLFFAKNALQIMVNAFVTLATNDGYATGALVLAHSLKEVGTQHALHVLYTEGVSTALR
jgi:glycogenin glucosyltransferase